MAGRGDGRGLLTKLSALFFLALVPLAVALWRPTSLRSWWRLAQAYFLGRVVYSVLYASPIVDNIQTATSSATPSRWGRCWPSPRLWGDNLRFIVGAAGVYLGWPHPGGPGRRRVASARGATARAAPGVAPVVACAPCCSSCSPPS